MNKTTNSMIIREVQATMDELGGVLVKYEKRESNFEAHNLAKAAVSLNHGRYLWLWLLSTPDIACIPVNVV